MARSSPDYAAPDPVRRRPDTRGRVILRLLVAAPVAAGHLLLLLILAAPGSGEPPSGPAIEPAVTALLFDPPPPTITPAPSQAPAAPATASAAAAPRATPMTPVLAARPARRPPPVDVRPLAAAPARTGATGVFLGEGALAGARVAGSGGGGASSGQGCDMVRRLQDALTADADIRAAVDRGRRGMGAGDRALLVWNGEWLRSPGQDGKGLAGVRQAIAMEVAFAPAACRAEPVRGLVVIALGEGPAAPRLALGAGDWRWSDLLSAGR